jgi:hypothetical protein
MAGAQTATSAVVTWSIPAFSPPSSSATLVRDPFIFQFPATNGCRMSYSPRKQAA